MMSQYPAAMRWSLPWTAAEGLIVRAELEMLEGLEGAGNPVLGVSLQQPHLAQQDYEAETENSEER